LVRATTWRQKKHHPSLSCAQEMLGNEIMNYGVLRGLASV
jgi:hypothetical protein